MSQWINVNGPDLTQLQRRVDVAEAHLRQTYFTALRTQRKSYCAYAAERLRAEGRPARKMPEFRSQYGEDMLLFELFEGQFEGFFIEAGAFNDVDFSATYVFEQLGWHGLLVEPIPQRFEECRVNRPHARVVHAALGAPNNPKLATLEVTGDIYWGMLSFVNAGGEHHKRLAASELPKSSVSVPQLTLDEILGFDHERIDLAILDVEANELRVLAGFDLTQHGPRVLVVEDGSLGRNEPLQSAITKHPYALAGWGGENAIYIHKDEVQLWRRWADMGRG
jgi:FkbM family methyltransferase